MGTTDQNYATLGPGLGGFLLTFFLAVALVLLVRSMVGHLRKVRYSPDPAAEPPTPWLESAADGGIGETAAGDRAAGDTAAGDTTAADGGTVDPEAGRSDGG